jgi:transcriptional regulator with XRE-family HTH domain
MIDMDELRQIIGVNVRALRKAQGWTQEQLGEQAEMSYKALGEIERGEVSPSLNSLLKIANALQIQISELFLSDEVLILTKGGVAEVNAAMDALNRVLSSARRREAF